MLKPARGDPTFVVFHRTHQIVHHFRKRSGWVTHVQFYLLFFSNFKLPSSQTQMTTRAHAALLGFAPYLHRCDSWDMKELLFGFSMGPCVMSADFVFDSSKGNSLFSHANTLVFLEEIHFLLGFFFSLWIVCCVVQSNHEGCLSALILNLNRHWQCTTNWCHCQTKHKTKRSTTFWILKQAHNLAWKSASLMLMIT